MISRRCLSTILTAFLLIGTMIAAPLVSSAVSSWLGVTALALLLWPLLVDLNSTATIAVGHLGLVASCFAIGVHDEHRNVWLTLLATFAVLPLAWAFRRGGRATKGAAGLVLVALTFGVFAWSTEKLDHGPLSVLPQLLLFPTAPPAKPARPPWARDVT
jgi:hypothetical protein